MADNTDQTDTTTNEEVLDAPVEAADDQAFEDVTWDDGEEVTDDDQTDGGDDVSTDTEAEAEPVETEDESEADVADDKAEEEPAEQPEADTPSESDKDTKGEPDPDKAREAYLRRKIQREEREKAERITLDQYLKDAEGDEAESAKRQLEVEAYAIAKERAAINEEKLTNSVLRAKAEIPLLSSTDPVVQEALGRALDNFQAMYVETNQYGDVLGVKADVYQYLKAEADTISRLTGVGARQESQKKAATKARTLTPPSRAPKPEKVDPDLAAFDEEAYKTY